MVSDTPLEYRVVKRYIEVHRHLKLDMLSNRGYRKCSEEDRLTWRRVAT